MILKYPHFPIKWTKNNKIDGSSKVRKYAVLEVQCDKCNKIFIIQEDIFNNRLKYTNGKEYCGLCSRSDKSRLGGLAATYDKDGNLKPNSGRFSSERVKALSEEEYKKYCEHRKKIAIDFHKTLRADDEKKKEHYKKVFKNSRIGYVSKAQRNIFEILKNDGFELEYMIGGCHCDIVNPKTKIVIEYNGDFWHANPRKYKPKDYMTILKMTAEEKWEKDRKRRFFLRSKGYNVIVIWEDEWINERKSVIAKLKKIVTDGYSLPNWFNTKFEVKTKKMKNMELCVNKYIKLKDVDSYLKNGWEFGHILNKDKNEIIKNRKN